MSLNKEDEQATERKGREELGETKRSVRRKTTVERRARKRQRQIMKNEKESEIKSYSRKTTYC